MYVWSVIESITHASPANRTVRKIREDVRSPAWVQAPVEADRYQGVAMQWYSPLSLETHTHTVRHCSSDCGCYNNETLSLSLSLSRSPVLSSMNVQHVGVCVFALYWNVTRWVAGFFPHNSKAVDTGHLGRRLSTTQPGEKPTHLVRQVIWDRQKGRGTGGERWLSRAVIYFWKKLWAW